MCTDCCPRPTSSKGIASSLVASQAQGEPRAWQRMKQVAKDRQQPAVCVEWREGSYAPGG